MTIGYNSSAFSSNPQKATKLSGDYTAGNFRFIPTFWSSKFIEAFYNKTVFAEIANTNYQGEISAMGDKVVIPITPSVTINPYLIGDTLSYERPKIETVELDIDKAKMFAYKVNDVERMQAKPAYVSAFAESAAEQMKVAIDADILNGLHLLADPDNVGPAAGKNSGAVDLGDMRVDSPSPYTAGNLLVLGDGTGGTVDPYVLLSRLATVLDEQNAPETGRWVVVSPLFRMAMQSSKRAIALIQGSNEQLLRNGYIGTVDRFKVYVSNQLKVDKVTAFSPPEQVSATHIVAGHVNALTFASQMTKVETLRDQNDFGDLMRGLQVFGYKVIDPKLLTQASVVVG